MSDENAQDSAPGGNDSGWTPPATQEDLNRIIAERVSREKAKYADYSDLKAKASRLDDIEAANKSDLDRVTERAAAAEAALAAKEAEALRLTVIARHQIPAEYHDLIVGDSEESLEAKADRVAALIATSAKTDPFPKADPSQGAAGGGKTSNADLFAEFAANKI